MLEQFGDNLTVTTSDISKLVHFPPEYYLSLLLYNPLLVYQKKKIARISAILPKAGWKCLLKKAKMDILNLLFSSEHIISYYIDFPHNPF